jgi:uncharacterized alpha-E superfamily protein
MLARVAENLYWISRYVERAEHAARLLDDAYHRELDAGLVGDPDGGRPLEAVARLLGCPDVPEGREAVLDTLTFDRANPCSIWAMIARARENARGSQETLSAEGWSQLNQLYLYLGSARARQRLQASPFRFFDRVRRECLLFAARVDGTLPRNEVFHFLQLGRSLERADLTSRIVHARLAGADETGWASLLRVCSAHEAYLKLYQDRIHPEGVIGLLVLSGDFPRAVRFGVARCLESLRAIGGEDGLRTAAERRLGRLESDLRYSDAAEQAARGVGPLLHSVQEACALAGGEIHQAYFLT